MMACRKAYLAVAVANLAMCVLPQASSAKEAAKELLLSSLWRPGPNGMIVQVPASTKLVIDSLPGGKPYVLNGRRLVVRAAAAELRGAVSIRAWPDGATPKKRSPYPSAAAKGADGEDAPEAKEGGNGSPGAQGADGGPGENGFAAGPVLLNIGSLSGAGTLVVVGIGSRGGEGQDGQTGGKGGQGGRGGDADTNVAGLNCNSPAGRAGYPGDGGPGGKGGKGGSGGDGAAFRISSAVDAVAAKFGAGSVPVQAKSGTIQIFYAGGAGAPPGAGGPGGDGGEGNDGGSGEGLKCPGGKASDKKPPTPQQTENLGFGASGKIGSVTVIK